MTIQIFHQKKAARNFFKHFRLNVSEIQKAQSEDAINQSLTFLCSLFPKSFPIAAYFPFKKELSVIPTCSELLNLDYKIALPVIKKDCLIFREWDSHINSLSPNKYNILEPSIGDQIVPKIIIVPSLACDNNFVRLGYGKGYYDKTISQLKKDNNILLVTVCYDEQLVKTLPVEELDQRVDIIITPTKLITPLKIDNFQTNN
jgi:5-formyltetrahydrofolate cyclo-ligase